MPYIEIVYRYDVLIQCSGKIYQVYVLILFYDGTLRYHTIYRYDVSIGMINTMMLICGQW